MIVLYSVFFIFVIIGADMYAIISHGLQKKLQLISFFMLSGMISMFKKSNNNLTMMIEKIRNQIVFQKNIVKKINIFRKKIDSFNRRYGIS